MGDSPFPVVGIGASAGGIEALEQFFTHLPADLGMAFVVIVHLPANRPSVLDEIIARWTSMPVVTVSTGGRVTVEPNTVYVPSPHAIVRFSDHSIIVERPQENGDRLFRPIDVFFDSLAAELRDRAVGIVLSGMDSDGSLGLKAIKECGGLTLAQGNDGTVPRFPDMPAGAIATGAVDIVASVEEMPGFLLRLNHANSGSEPAGGSGLSPDAFRLQVCGILRARLGHDFGDYRAQTFLRRVARRMQILGISKYEDYIAHLGSQAGEVTLLFRDLLIRVTSFFRDQDTFETLARKVIPALFEGKMADSSVRVWIPGCATGEEAYSLAMLLREHMDTLTAAPKVQIFATDIDESSIATARLGRYPSTLVQGLSETRLRRFFSVSHGIYCVNREIRDLCTFSSHNLVRDPPFSAMSLVSCRNLLIYMNPKLQARIIPTFHYSLVPGGVLLLGGSESAAQHGDLFEPIDKAARIFRRVEGQSPETGLTWHRQYLTAAAAVDRAHDVSRMRSVLQPPVPPVRRRESSGLEDSERFKALLGSLEPSAESVRELQDAMKAACEELRSLTEEHQTALEELRSTNEELHSVNEEMQSTNEELQTSKEELQSLNEELHTVNTRLTEKIEELDHTNSDLRNLFESTEIATIFLDRNLIIRSFTPAIGGLYNLIPSDVGRPLTDIVSKLDYGGLREDISNVVSKLEPLERRVVRSDKRAQFIVRILPYRELDSRVSGVLLTFIDVSSIVQAEEALLEADVRKDVFLATLSHELRNPLAPIRIAAQLLQSPDLRPMDQQKARDVIARQVTHMSALLDDLLDVSRITRGSFLLKKDYVDVQRLVDEAVEAARPALDAKRHTLRVQTLSRPLIIEVDPLRITQVITNLLTNAVKYTPSGGLIQLKVELDSTHLTIAVLDNGVGLSADAMTRVFDMFSRIKSDETAAEGGLGIGLALARGLMELHGGQIKVRSDGTGKGCDFTACLPRSVVTDRELEGSGSARIVTSLRARKILIADDNRDGAETMKILLEAAGHEVQIAGSGMEALENARRVHPDVALLDIGMPDLNGYDLASRLRHEAWGKEMTLIAITGWGQDADRRRAMAAGFDHHLTKPVEPARLLESVNR